MNVVVIGAGLIGLTTAYYLRERGFDVTVIDREKGPGLAASFANGALLTASMSEPWNVPGSWRAINFLAGTLRRAGAITPEDSPATAKMGTAVPAQLHS